MLTHPGGRARLPSDKDYLNVNVSNDLIRLKEAIATKRVRRDTLFQDVDELEGPARDERANSIKSINSELTGLIEQAEKLTAEVQLQKLERDTLKAMRQPIGRQIDPADDNNWSGSSSESPRSAGPHWGQAVVQAAEAQAGARGLKSLLPSGSAVVEVPIGGPIENPRRASFLAQLMPVKDAAGGHFSYLRQAVRTNNAAIVGEGALKPTSVFTLEKIEAQTDVIAHLSEAVPTHYFEDSDSISQFVEAEMRLGVNLAVDAAIVSDIFDAPILEEGDIGTTLDTCRRAITRLQEREVEATAFVFHPRDWEQVELEMTAVWFSNSNVPSPNDEIRRSLYGIPVIVSNAMTENTGLLGDFRSSAALYRTGGVSVTWNAASTELFDYNLIKMRAEGRFAAAVYRPFAFVSINLAGTGS